MKKIIIFVLINFIVFFGVSINCFAAGSLDQTGIKISVLSFENKAELRDYNYLSKSIQNSIYEALNLQDGIEVVPNNVSDESATEVGLKIENRDNLSVMMRYAVETTANVIVIGEYTVHPEENLIDINVYVYSIAQRSIIINISDTASLDDTYELLDMIAQKTSDEVKKNRGDIEIAIEEVVKNATPPEYSSKPQIKEISIEGIRVEWVTTKETASFLLLLASKDKNDVIKKFGDKSEDAIHHSVIIPINMFQKNKDTYFITLDTDFIGNKVNSSMIPIKNNTIHNELSSQYTEKKQELLDKAIDYEESEKLGEALSTLEDLQDVIIKYDSYLNLNLDKDEISQRIELLKIKINKVQEMIGKNGEGTQTGSSDTHIEDGHNNDNDGEGSQTINNGGDEEETGTEKEEALIRYETGIPLYYNATSSKRFKNDTMIELKRFTSGSYQSLSITNSIISLGSSATYLLTMIPHINNNDIFDTPFIVVYDAVVGVSLSVNSIISTIQYIKYYRELKSIMSGVKSGELMFSQEYSNIRRIYGKLRKINKNYGKYHMISGGLSTFIGILLLIERGNQISAAYDGDDTIDADEQHIISVFGSTGSYFTVHGLTSFIYGGINLMLQPQMPVRPTMLMKDSASLFKRDLTKYGWNLAKYSSDVAILNGFASPLVIFSVWSIAGRSNNIRKTLTELSEGKIFYSDAYSRLRASDKKLRGAVLIWSIIQLTVSAGVMPILTIANYENFLSSQNVIAIGSFSGLLSLGAITFLTRVKTTIPHQNYYLESFKEQDIPYLDKESEFSYIFKQNAYTSARLRHKNFSTVIAIDSLSLYGIGLGYAHILANNINPRMDLRALDSVLLVTPFVAETTLMILSIAQRRKLNNTLNVIRDAKVSFNEAYPRLKKIYSNFSILNLISGLSYTAFGLTNFIYALTTANFDTDNDGNSLTDELRLSGMILASSFMIPVGIYHLTKVGAKLPDPEHYYLDEKSLAFNFTPYPTFSTDGEFGLGFSLSLSW